MAIIKRGSGYYVTIMLVLCEHYKGITITYNYKKKCFQVPIVAGVNLIIIYMRDI